MNKFYINDIKKNINEYISNIDKEYINENDIKFIKHLDFNYDNICNLYNILTEIKPEFKLPSYIKNECIDTSGKSSETVYNKNLSEKYPNKYILLDKKCIGGIEVADIYDTEHNLLFHNKKCKDLRVVCSQICSGALVLNNKEKHKKYLNMLNDKGINITINDNFKYVVGIIGDKKIASKDILALGVTKFILDNLKIELFIDFIEEIK
jgi:hypothetical protein